jgi:hypothetical protein
MAAEPTGSAISHSDRPGQIDVDAGHQTDADNDRDQAEQLSTSNAFTEDNDRKKNGQNRRHAAERARDIWAHQPVGLKV